MHMLLVQRKKRKRCKLRYFFLKGIMSMGNGVMISLGRQELQKPSYKRVKYILGLCSP